MLLLILVGRGLTDSWCGPEECGLLCAGGEVCGETYPEVVMECQDSQWIGYYVDTLCILGLAPPCPDDTTTTTTSPGLKSEETTSSNISECPAEWPEQDSPCTDGLECPYGMEECCGEMIPDVIFQCHNGER